ncbi:MAG: YhgE/Pip family protein [Culicoidibacterales bacterium]
MKGIWEIFWYDLKQLKGNYAAIIVVIALAILPSLYAWFNIVASWDPYGNTNQIQVAVVNEDTGSNLRDKAYLLGDDVVDKLTENDQMDWQFVTAAEAEVGLNEGEYYASLTIPADFSTKVLSITSNEVTQATIIYTSNQKINAIAPKITDKGASALQEQINQTVITTIGQVVLETAQATGVELDAQTPKIAEAQTALTNVQAKIDLIATTLASGETTVQEIQPLLRDVQAELPNVTQLVDDAIEVTTAMTTFTNELASFFNQIGPEITANLQLMTTLTNEIANKATNIAGYLNDPEQINLVIESLQTMEAQLTTAQTFTSSLVTVVQELQAKYPDIALQTTLEQLESLNQLLTEGINYLAEVQTKVLNGETLPQTSVEELVRITGSIATTTKSVADFIPNELLPSLETIQTKLSGLSTGIETELEKVNAAIPGVATALTSSLETLNLAQVTIDEVQTIIPKLENLIAEVTTSLTSVESSEVFNVLERLLSLNIEQNLDYLEQPVEIENQVIYPIANYGSAMTPFYTTLSLWVGCLLLVSILKVETKMPGNHKPYQVFLGKYGLFFCIAMAQALIVSMGDLWLLDVQVLHAPEFIGISLLSSCVFSFFVYSCVSVFGATGKVIGIILLVLQVAGSGGTFPIQLTPDFFQNLYPWLPFTYAISAMRETLGGIVWPIFIRDSIILCSYFGVTLLFALTLKKPINKISEPFAKKFESSGLGE